MGLIAVLTVLLQPGLLREGFHSGFRLAAKLAVHFKCGTRLIEQFLQGFDVSPNGAVLQQPAAQRVHSHRINGWLCAAGISVVNERQLVRVCPGTLGYLCFYAAPAEALPFDRFIIADVVPGMAVLVQSDTGDLWQRVDGTPVSAFGLGLGT